VRLKALTNQYGEFNQATEATARIASTLRMNTAEAAQSFALLYSSLRPTGITVKELEDTLIGFAAAARNSGATAQETSNALIQLKQGLASGVLQGEELRSIREQAPLVAQAIAREMGVSIGALKSLAAEGKVTTDVVLRAMQRLKGEQLGKLNAQFNTAEQAMTDFGNAAKDAGAELSKLFGPTVIAGLRLLTGAIKSVTNELRFRSREEEITSKAREQAAIDVQKKYPGIEGALALTPRSRGFFDERTRQIEARLRTQVNAPVILTPEQRADKEAARQERLRAGQAAGTEKPRSFKPSSKAQALIAAANRLGVSPLDLATLISFETGGSFSPSIVGGAGGNYQGLIQFGPPERRQYGMNRGQSFEEQIQGPVVRYFQDRFAQAGMSTQGADLLKLYTTVLAGSPSANPNARDAFGTSARSGVAAMGPHRQRALQMFFGGSMENVGYSSAEAGANMAKAYEQQAEAAEDQAKQAQKTLETNRELNKTRLQSLQSTINENAQVTKGLQIARATDETTRLRLQKEQELLDLEIKTREKLKTYLDEEEKPLIMDTYRKEKLKIELKYAEEIYALETARASENWQQSQVNLQATLTDYYQRQADILSTQNELAGNIAQTLGQGLSQALNLAIQGTDDWNRSLSEIASSTLRSIADQLIQIAVITPVINGLRGLLGGPAAGIAPIAPGIPALPGGDFTGAFTGGGGMAFTGALPSASFSPGAFTFATGGIMTSQGPVPLRSYARGGVAMAPQAAIYGEGSTPEAFVPLPDGRRIPVALRQYPGIPGGPGAAAGFEQTDAVVQRLVESARQESAVRAATTGAAGPDGTMRIQIETTRINSVEYITAAQAEALAQAAATRSTARQQRALQASPAARRSVGI
jgi:tape measure domain-containing protein